MLSFSRVSMAVASDCASLGAQVLAGYEGSSVLCRPGIQSTVHDGARVPAATGNADLETV